MKKKKGFTLIELLAIIVILAIIAVITVPLILGIIDDSKEKASIASAYGFKDAIEKNYAKRLLNNNEQNLNGTYMIENGKLNNQEILASGTKPSNGILTYENNKLVSGCLTIDGYKVQYQNDKFTATKGECGAEEGYLTCSGNEYLSNEALAYAPANVPTQQNACEAYAVEYLNYIDNVEEAHAFCNGETITHNNNEYSFQEYMDFNALEEMEKSGIVDFHEDVFTLHNENVMVCEYMFTNLAGLTAAEASTYCGGGTINKTVDGITLTSFSEDQNNEMLQQYFIPMLIASGIAVQNGNEYILDNNLESPSCEFVLGLLGLNDDEAINYCNGGTTIIEGETHSYHADIKKYGVGIAGELMNMGVLEKNGDAYTLNNTRSLSKCEVYFEQQGVKHYENNHDVYTWGLQIAMQYCNDAETYGKTFSYDLEHEEYDEYHINEMLENDVIREITGYRCKPITYTYVNTSTNLEITSQTLPQNTKVYIKNTNKPELCGVENGETFCLSDNYSENAATLNRLYSCEEEEVILGTYNDKNTGIMLLGYKPNNVSTTAMSLPTTSPSNKNFTCASNDLRVDVLSNNVLLEWQINDINGGYMCNLYNNGQNSSCISNNVAEM